MNAIDPKVANARFHTILIVCCCFILARSCFIGPNNVNCKIHAFQSNVRIDIDKFSTKNVNTIFDKKIILKSEPNQKSFSSTSNVNNKQ